MRVTRVRTAGTNSSSLELLDDAGQPVPVVAGFLRHLAARGYSPNTLSAYAYDLLHFLRFLTQLGLTYEDFGPERALGLLQYLRAVPNRRSAQRLAPVL